MIVFKPLSYAGIAAAGPYLAAGLDMNGNVRCKRQMPDSALRVGDTLLSAIWHRMPERSG